MTRRTFVRAETARHFIAQLARAPLNAFHHEIEPATTGRPGAIRPNPDVLLSHAVTDVTEEATFTIAPSDEYQADQVIDEHHRTVAVVYPGESVRVTSADLSAGSHVYVLGRTALSGGLARARELQALRRIASATAEPYRPPTYDEGSRRRVAAELGPQLDWGRLPREHARYFEGVATSSGCDVWTFEAPPVDPGRNGFYSVTRYDEHGRIDVEHAAIAGTEMTRNGDGTISVYFDGDAAVATGNVIRTTPGQVFRYAMRLYAPGDANDVRRYLELLRARGLTAVLR